jgi:D-amino-acid dehydrogenase
LSQELVIAGGGIIGLSAAYHALERGWHVTVIERRPAGRDGCSFGNAGMVVPSHFVPLAAPGMVALGLKWMWNPESPFYLKPRLDAGLLAWAWRFYRAANAGHVRRAAPLLRDLSFASRACFEELEAALPGGFGLERKGLLMLCRTAHALDEEARTAAQAVQLGVPAEVLDARQTAALDPGVTMNIAGAVYFPRDCHLSPNRLMAALQRRLESGGARFLWDTEITGWRRDGPRLRAAVTPAGEVPGDEFVLCGGSWSPGLARGLGLRLPMQAGKGYSLTLARPPQLPRLCAIFTEARVAVTPMGASLRIGGTMEISGLDERIEPRRVAGIIKAVPQYYPEFRPGDFAGVEPWRGLRPCSPDGLPYLGRTRAAPNLVVATGHAMMGLSLGPITGRLVAQLLAGETTPFDLGLLSPDRYA